MRVGLLVLVIFFLAACGARSPKLVPPPEKVEEGKDVADLEQSEGPPQVDVLFVVDNSLSMTVHQENLARNLDGFVNAFSRNQIIDFHLAVTPIYDSDRFQVDQAGQTVLKPGKFPTDCNNPPNCKKPLDPPMPLGQLVPLKGTEQGLRFVTRDTPNFVNVLRNTLFLGVSNAPEDEEMFSPVLAAISPELSQTTNAGFYRKDAHLIVVIITDADDSSHVLSPFGVDSGHLLGPDEFYEDLLAAKDGEKEKVLPVGVIIPVDQAPCPRRDPSGPPYRITSFLTMSSGSTLNLCSKNFGQELATIGGNLERHVARQVIKLSATRDADRPIQVFYGGHPVKEDYEKGWYYDDKKNAVVISPDAEIAAQAGAKFTVKYTGIRLANEPSGRLHVVQ